MEVIVQLGAAAFEFGRELVAGGVTLFLHMAEFMEMGMVVFPQSARIEIDHVFELVQAVLDLDHLVDLFLVLDDDEARAAMVQHIGHLFGGRSPDRAAPGSRPPIARRPSTSRDGAGCCR